MAMTDECKFIVKALRLDPKIVDKERAEKIKNPILMSSCPKKSLKKKFKSDYFEII
jgi:hypothetical protein